MLLEDPFVTFDCFAMVSGGVGGEEELEESLSEMRLLGLLAMYLLFIFFIRTLMCKMYKYELET